MGQRSEVYVAFETNEGKKRVAARWFGWNYGERMVSRITHTAMWLQDRIRTNCGIDMKDLVSTIETNFDLGDHQRSDDLENVHRGNTETASLHISGNDDLNDGRGFLFVTADGGIRYCLTDNRSLKPLDADGYMYFDTEDNYPQYRWTREEYRNSERMRKCRENIKWLSENASVMTQEELDEFISSKYTA